MVQFNQIHFANWRKELWLEGPGWVLGGDHTDNSVDCCCSPTWALLTLSFKSNTKSPWKSNTKSHLVLLTLSFKSNTRLGSLTCHCPIPLPWLPNLFKSEGWEGKSYNEKGWGRNTKIVDESWKGLDIPSIKAKTSDCLHWRLCNVFSMWILES